MGYGGAVDGLLGGSVSPEPDYTSLPGGFRHGADRIHPLVRAGRLRPHGHQPEGGAPAAEPAPVPGREDRLRPPGPPGPGGDPAGEELPGAAARPRGHAGRHRPDGPPPVHDARALPEVAVPYHRPLRPPDPGRGRRQPGPGPGQHGEQPEVYDFLRRCSDKYGIGFWKPGQRHHPPGGARELRLPRRHDDRHRLAHAQRRRPGHGRHRRGRRRRRRRHGGHALGAEAPKLIGVQLTGHSTAGPRPRTSSSSSRASSP